MFNKIAIKNFKNISDWQELKLAPITLIYGPNSSGKTSIIQALLLLQQTMMRPNVNGGLVTNGMNLKLGQFPVIANKHNVNCDIEFKIDYLQVKRESNKEQKYEKSFHFTYGYIDNSTYSFSFLKNYKYNLELNIGGKRKKINNSFTSMLEKVNSKKLNKSEAEKKSVCFKYDESNEYLFEDILNLNIDKAIIKKMLNLPLYKSTLNFSVPSSTELSFELKPNTALEIHKEQLRVTQTVNTIIVDIANDLKSKLSGISYIGPLRKRIEKVYVVENDYETTVGIDGEKIGYFLYSDEKDLLKRINYYFKTYSIPYELMVKKIGDDFTGPTISIQLLDTRTNTIVGPSDVGVGISQLLPIIVEGCIREKSTICVEQPEIHLHPKLQADLAEFFIDTCKNNQWLIETHSEAMMLRIQKLLRNKDPRINCEDVSIIYVRPSHQGSKLYQIRLDEDGNFRDEWPQGFFEERINEFFGK